MELTQLQALNSSDESETTIVDSEQRLSLMYQSPRHEQLSGERGEEARRDREKSSISTYFRVAAVWKEREVTAKAHPQTHHFNWYGDPVDHPVQTSPEESLALILATPKIPTGSSEHRVQSILNRATKFVDPVAVNIDGLDHKTWDLGGSEMVRAVGGRVCRLYSPHGGWVTSGEESDSIITDTSDVVFWDPAIVIMANGMIENERVPTWKNRCDWKKRLRDQRTRNRTPRRLEFKPSKSFLHVMDSLAC